MIFTQFKINVVLISGLLMMSMLAHAGETYLDKHIRVSLRMIGHEVLLNAGDSTSRVLPITESKGRFEIQFEHDLEIHPDALVNTVSRIVEETNLATRYIVEIQECALEHVVYSYEVVNPEGDDIIPCRARLLPKQCYKLFFTIIPETINYTEQTPSKQVYNQSNQQYAFAFSLFLVLSLGLLYKKVKDEPIPNSNSNIISLGAFDFDKLNMTLQQGDQIIELSSKESQLLELLYENLNITVEKEVILNIVWGDQGDYVGRTLDVFISKLRKKLASDVHVKIVNIRGVGYKLIVNE